MRTTYLTETMESYVDGLNDTLTRVKMVFKEALQLEESFLESDGDLQLIGNIPEFDSMAVVLVIGALEDSFNISIDDDDIDVEMFATIDSLAAFVDSKLSA